LKIEGEQLNLKGNMYSMFYVSLINYDAKDSDLAKKGWLEVNDFGVGSMQDVFKTRYAMYCIFICFSQFYLICIIMQYSCQSLLPQMQDCQLYNGVHKDDILYDPNHIMVAQLIMALMLHLQIEPQTANGFMMMKFALNHPNRFHKNTWGIAFGTGFVKVSIVMLIEIMNILALLVKCDTIDVLTGYLRYYAIVNFDTYIFDGLNASAPFYTEVFNNALLVIDRTTSLKNNWSGKTVTYVESLDKIQEP